VPAIERWARSALGLPELSRSDAETAHAELARAVEVVRASRFRHPRFFSFWRDAFNACGRAACEALAQAAAIFQRCGASPRLEHARQELERTGAHHVDHWELTPTEDQVARLAAGGREPRDRGALFMSVKTVEANLARIYGKLGVCS
jgi:DNA-binding CsgD family transcriptional regulator